MGPVARGIAVSLEISTRRAWCASVIRWRARCAELRAARIEEESGEALGNVRGRMRDAAVDPNAPFDAEAIADGTVEGKDARIRAADVISSESRRLERLVADLLDLARLDAHQFSLHPTPVDARAVVRDAVEAFRPAGGRHRASPSRSSRASRSRRRSIAQRLAQIVANLVENALKFATSARAR